MLKILKSSVFIYIASRYGTLALQFCNSLFIANILGPQSLGIWGYFSLLFLYFIQLNFGVPQAAGNQLAVNYPNNDINRDVFGNSIILLSFVSFFFFALWGIYYFIGVDFGSNYKLNNYLWIIVGCGILNLFVINFSNLFRTYGRLSIISLSQSLPVLLNVVALLVVRESDVLLNTLMYVQLLSLAISIVLFTVYSPIRIKLSFDLSIAKNILTKGIFIFLFNIAFYLILLSTRTFVSNYYSVTEFGYFTFCFSLGYALVLLLESLNYLVYPKLISLFSKLDPGSIQVLIDRVRNAYSLSTFFVVYLACAIIPILLFLFPAYQNTSTCLRVILLAIGLNSTCFGFSTLLISKGRERIVAIISIVALFINIITAMLLIFYFKVDYDIVMFCTMVSYAINSILLTFFGQKFLKIEATVSGTIASVFKYSFSTPLVFTILAIFTKADDFYYIIIFIIFLLMNKASLISVFKLSLKLIKSPSAINLN